jgi:predicted HTH transcriptional regulator
MCDTIARGVAALGNTYGGLLLVGVTDDRIVRGVREKTIESVADHCAAKIEPPWVPEIIAVPLGQSSDLYVLVLRVVPGHHPRPLLVVGVAYIRHQNTTHPAVQLTVVHLSVWRVLWPVHGEMPARARSRPGVRALGCTPPPEHPVP